MEYYINCAVIGSREELHRILARLLEFPAWYGHNLDALHDLLTSRTTETRLHFYNWECTTPFSRGFKRVLEDAQRENPRLTVVFQ